MSNKNKQKKSSWGGRREGAGVDGRKGGTAKICVSVHGRNWNTALKRWNKKPSWLVDGLISRYVETGGGILKTEAAI
ncbi:MAG: hypothetical protein ACREC8_09210 [Limisphaerales bacterium]